MGTTNPGIPTQLAKLGSQCGAGSRAKFPALQYVAAIKEGSTMPSSTNLSRISTLITHGYTTKVVQYLSYPHFS